jgi:hypothetical protein
MHVRPARRDELPAIHAINQAEVPAVSDLEPAALEWLFEAAARCAVAEIDGALAGFLLALRPGVDYPSENYRWFSARYDDFWYVDRLAVAPDHRRRGVARALYADAERCARAVGAPRIACEVNVRPRNDASLAFHAELGFEEVGRQETEGGRKAVVMLARPVGPAPSPGPT